MAMILRSPDLAKTEARRRGRDGGDLRLLRLFLYFEGGSPSGKLLDFQREHGIPERAHVAYGTIWPKPTVFHLPATPETMMALTELMRLCAYPELAIHFHVYRDQTVLVEWHDAFPQPDNDKPP